MSSFGQNDFHKFSGNESCYDRNFFNSYKKNFEDGNQQNFNYENRLEPINQNFNNLQQIYRKPYVEHIDIKNRSQDEINIWYAENEVILDGHDIPRPIFKFNESLFSSNFFMIY